ncbi:ATP-binding protein [Streptomyces chiangmaiensis]|uniref:ATP-binding protein n=1 Tax=Streptomyces chiangmaiensis TaxID=766497 RepID=A0ABU7FA10_9ACTN|nr:ATP-binding protein [Streptomyces chiangmaiensis]MED7821016.1 ATP-binding protein [Streptomyces chiangmaiensis]
MGRLPGDASPHRSDVFGFPAVPAAVGLVRRNVRELLVRWGAGGGTVDNAVIVTCELVTNAVVHTASERIVCRVHTDGRLLHIEVLDENHGETRPARCRPGPDDQSGRGLLLVDVLCSDWGVRDAQSGFGRVVWAELTPEPGEAAATGSPGCPHLRPVPHPAEGSPQHGTTARR